MSKESSISDIYRKFGSAANNTTIPADERERIYAAKEGIDGAIRRGEMACAALCEEWGLKPRGDWMDWIGVDKAKLAQPFKRSELSLTEQRKDQKQGIPLSKSTRNLTKFRNKDHKP